MLREINREKDTVLIRNKKGQALVEFVMLLPILVVLLFLIIDVANIYFKKAELENTLDSVCDMVIDGKDKTYILDKIDNNDITYDVKIDGSGYATVYLNYSVKPITPGVYSLFKNINITTKRVILYE